MYYSIEFYSVYSVQTVPPAFLPFSFTSGGRGQLLTIKGNGEVSWCECSKIFHFRNGLGK